MQTVLINQHIKKWVGVVPGPVNCLFTQRREVS